MPYASPKITPCDTPVRQPQQQQTAGTPSGKQSTSDLANTLATLRNTATQVVNNATEIVTAAPALFAFTLFAFALLNMAAQGADAQTITTTPQTQTTTHGRPDRSVDLGTYIFMGVFASIMLSVVAWLSCTGKKDDRHLGHINNEAYRFHNRPPHRADQFELRTQRQIAERTRAQQLAPAPEAVRENAQLPGTQETPVDTAKQTETSESRPA